MSERERWIVYPLLFLALGAALRDKLLKQTIVDRVHCEELIIYNPAGNPAGLLNAQGMSLEGGLRAKRVDSDQVVIAGRAIAPVRPTQRSPSTQQQFWQALQSLQRMGLLRVTPGPAAGGAQRPEVDPRKEASPPNKQPKNAPETPLPLKPEEPKAS